jgi:hypothetical protein
MNTLRTLGLCAAGLMMLATTLDADARRRGGFRARGLAHGAVAKGPVLSREQLRVCVQIQRSLGSTEKSIGQMQSQLRTQEDALNRLGREIELREPAVDRYSQASIDAFNEMVNRHGQMVAAYNARLPTVNGHVEAMNRSVDAFNDRCADREYYESDMVAVGGR